MDAMYTPAFDWFSVISMIANIVLGGGLIVTLVTLKAQKKQAEANAKQAEASAKQTEISAEGSEIDNVDKVAKMWREYAEAAELRYQETQNKANDQMQRMQERMSEMECTIKKLTATNNQILKILKDINHDNLEQKKAEASNIAGG